MTDSAVTTWTAALELFEERLHRFRAVLADDAAPPTGTWPPAELTGIPLPRQLADRAEQLVKQAYELEKEIISARESRRPVPKTNGYRRPITARATISAKL